MENEEKQKSRGIRVWGERCERAHSSTTLHYVRHFPEDSLGSENREDVGKGRCGGVRGGVRGEGQINTWLNRPENSFHPSGVSYGAAPSVGAPSTSDAPERVGTVLFRYFRSCDFASRIGGVLESRPDKTVTSVENTKTLLEPRILLTFAALALFVRFQLTLRMLYLI